MLSTFCGDVFYDYDDDDDDDYYYYIASQLKWCDSGVWRNQQNSLVPQK